MKPLVVRNILKAMAENYHKECMNSLLNEIDALKKQLKKLIDECSVDPIHSKEHYRIALTHSSNALEGNSLGLMETKVVLEDGIAIGGKPLLHHLEVLGHSDAFDCMYEYEGALSEDIIKRVHRLFYHRISYAEAGVYRDKQVAIGDSRFPLLVPEEVPGLMKEWLSEAELLRKELHPVVFTALVHKEFVCIHPFIDGNGRVGRLLMNLILLQEGYGVAVIAVEGRSEYIRCLEVSRIDETEFVRFVGEMVKESQKEYLRLFSLGS